MSDGCFNSMFGSNQNSRLVIRASVIGALAYLSVTDCLAAPQALLEKSIVANWTNVLAIRGPGGNVRSVTSSHRAIFYVSSKGRLFVKHFVQSVSTRSASRRSGGGIGKISPDRSDARRARFEGAQLLFTTQFVSGAANVTITFDERFASCTVKVVFGKLDGQQILQRIRGGAIGNVLSVTPSAGQCEIKDANLLTDHR